MVPLKYSDDDSQDVDAESLLPRTTNYGQGSRRELQQPGDQNLVQKLQDEKRFTACPCRSAGTEKKQDDKGDFSTHTPLCIATFSTARNTGPVGLPVLLISWLTINHQFSRSETNLINNLSQDYVKYLLYRYGSVFSIKHPDQLHLRLC